MESNIGSQSQNLSKSVGCKDNCIFPNNVNKYLLNQKFFGGQNPCNLITQNVLLQVFKKSKNLQVKKLLSQSIKKCSLCNC
jgi:hypothetical protein